MDDRRLTYAEAIREATQQAMELDERVILIGQGTRDAGAIFGTVTGLYDRYGPERVIEMPLSEAAITGIAIGAALAGQRPLLMFQRADFLFLVMDQLVNHAAKWRFMLGGHAHLPITVRSVIGKGWGQGPQHSQSPHAVFAHFPGLRVVLPASARDAKGLLLNGIFSDDPVVYFDARPLHATSGPVPEAPYVVPFGQATVVREGLDVTIAATSFLVPEAEAAAATLADRGVSAEVIDVASVSPVDHDTIAASVAKTGRLVVADIAWAACGLAAEISAEVNHRLFGKLRAPVVRVTPPFHPAPTAASLEAEFYPRAAGLVERSLDLIG